MKKPKYTRRTKYQLPKISDEYTVPELKESVTRLSEYRKWVIGASKSKKLTRSREQSKCALCVKKRINANLRANMKILKSVLRKNRNKPSGGTVQLTAETK